MTSAVSFVANYAFAGDANLVITILYFNESDRGTATAGFEEYWNNDGCKVLFRPYTPAE